MGKFELTWDMMKESWELLKLDKEILIFPFISGICCLIVLASFVMPLVNSPEIQMMKEGKQELDHAKYMILTFLFYFFNYLIIVFFNSAIVACALKRLDGGDPTVSYGLNAAMSMLPLIITWAAVAATVGMVLRAIEERSDMFGRIVGGIMGMAWSVMTFLVIPILVVEKKGPIAAVKESTRLLKRTWGQQLIGRFSFGLVFAVLGIPGYLLFFMGASSMSRGHGGIFLIALGIIYIIIISLVSSALQSIFQAIMYKYARDRQAPRGFNPYMLKGAFSYKKPNSSWGSF